MIVVLDCTSQLGIRIRTTDVKHCIVRYIFTHILDILPMIINVNDFLVAMFLNPKFIPFNTQCDEGRMNDYVTIMSDRSPI